VDMVVKHANLALTESGDETWIIKIYSLKHK